MSEVLNDLTLEQASRRSMTGVQLWRQYSLMTKTILIESSLFMRQGIPQSYNLTIQFIGRIFPIIIERVIRHYSCVGVELLLSMSAVHLLISTVGTVYQEKISIPIIIWLTHIPDSCIFSADKQLASDCRGQSAGMGAERM